MKKTSILFNTLVIGSLALLSACKPSSVESGEQVPIRLKVQTGFIENRTDMGNLLGAICLYQIASAEGSRLPEGAHVSVHVAGGPEGEGGYTTTMTEVFDGTATATREVEDVRDCEDGVSGLHLENIRLIADYECMQGVDRNEVDCTLESAPLR